jgi:uncharacterized membrane protein YGL010W
MRKIDELFEEYGESHQNHTNKAIHWICVPLIFFSVVGLLASIPSGLVQRFLGQGNPYANWAAVVLIFVVIYYTTLSLTLSLGMMLFGVLAPLWLVSIIIFVIAWIGQFYGHKIEGKKPSFLKDVQFLMIGPAWLMHFVYRKLGIPY